MFQYYTSAPLATTYTIADRLRIHIYTPLINYCYIPILITISILNFFILREVLGKGSTIVFHMMELLADVFMIISPWAMDIFRLDDLLGTCVFSPINKGNVASLTAIFVTNSPLAVVNSLLPVLCSLLLAIDRYRAVVTPITWKTQYDKVKYALKFTLKAVLILIVGSIVLWVIVIGSLALVAYNWPTINRLIANYSRLSGITNAYWIVAGQVVPVISQLIVDLTTVIICIFQIYVLVVFFRSFRKNNMKTLGDGEKKRLKEIKMVRGLVVGTICSQTLGSLVFSVMSLGTVPGDVVYYFSTSEQMIKSLMDQLKLWGLDKGGTIYTFCAFTRFFYGPFIMSSNLLTVFWHVLFCAQYRKGAKKVLGKILWKRNQVVPITGTTHLQTGATRKSDNQHLSIHK